jgi:hypothetical protein
VPLASCRPAFYQSTVYEIPGFKRACSSCNLPLVGSRDIALCMGKGAHLDTTTVAQPSPAASSGTVPVPIVVKATVLPSGETPL